MESGINQEQIVNAKYQIKEYSQLILSLLVTAIAILSFVFFVKPTYAKYQNIKLETKAQTDKEVILDAKLAQLQKAKELQSSIDQNIKLANQAVPDESDIPTVMAMVQEISSKSGVKVSTFSYIGLSKSLFLEAPVVTPKPASDANVGDTEEATPSGLEAPVNSDYFDSFNLSISVLGKFDNLNDFLLKIENSRRILDVSGFTYSVEKDNEQITSDFYTLKVQLTSYYRSFENTAPNVDLDKYTKTISNLNDMTFYEVDLNNSQVGKDDPFGANKSNTTPRNSESGTSQGSSGSSFFGNSGSSSSNANGGTGSNTGDSADVNVVEPEADQEADQGDVQKLLQDLLQKEGL